jgi:DNA-damage-inducible protein D
MPKTSIDKLHHATFEGIRQIDDAGYEYWSARQLAKVLEYSEYRHFLPVIDKAREACQNSRYPVADHFEDVLDMVEIGSGARRKVEDVRLSRYACYLIVQNGDPTKPVIANGQTYFALQTRRQELEDNAKFSKLSENEKRIAIRNELAANLFRATQAKEKLRRDQVRGKQQANQTHFEVGQKVRQTIQELGGTMPEALPTPEKSINQVGSSKKKREEK